MDTKGRNKVRSADKTAHRRTAAQSRERLESETQVHYAPAKPFNRNRFLLRLATVAAMVLAVVLGMSIFFRARQITVSGTEKYTPWDVKEASGIQDGDSLLGLSEARISARIRTALPYVGDVRVGIKLPDTVNIEITELAVVYGVEDSEGAWWLMDAAGRIVDKTYAATAKNYTCIAGVKVQNPAIGKQAIAAEGESTSGTPAERLRAATEILASLESNGILGKIAEKRFFRTATERLQAHLPRAGKEIKNPSVLYIKLYYGKNSFLYSFGCGTRIIPLKRFQFNSLCASCNNSHLSSFFFLFSSK